MPHLIARQPICNKNLKVVAFELLHRMNSTENHAVIDNADNATIDVLLTAYNDLSIEEIVGDNLAFVNFTSNIILNQIPPISAKQLVIELLEDQEISPELIKTLKELRKKGYKIALDDFCLNKETISLIECADIIKVDVLEAPPETWAEYIPSLKQRGISILAEKVENYDVYEKCRELGFDLFQGYFFAKPKIISGKKLSQNEVSILNLINKLSQKNIDYDEVVQVISNDVTLSFNLLRTVNSGIFSVRQNIDNIKQAAVTLGINNLKKWANFMSLSSLDDKPPILLESAMLRAKTCELLGERIERIDGTDDYFTIGLFSMLDAFFDMELEGLLEKLSLSDELNDAILKHRGVKGMVLKSVIAYEENQNIDKSQLQSLAQYDINQELLTRCHLKSVQWCNENKQI